MRAYWTLLLLTASAAGCTKENPAYCSEGDGCIGDLVCDLPTHTCVEQPCFGKLGWSLCVDPPPTRNALVLPETISTGPVDDGGVMKGTTSPLCLNPTPASWAMSVNQHDACVISAYSIVVDATVIVSGGRPLVLVANDEISVTGTLDVASHYPDVGAGAFNHMCDQGAGNADSLNQVGGGGGGGSFSTQGGIGGTGTGGAPGGNSGAMERPPFDTLHAGCRGGVGAFGGAYAGGGAGGGALYLVAGRSITIDGGTINASGDGGYKGVHPTGGAGGGGSGGMIVLDAPTIFVSPNARIVANGGAGGGGATTNSDGGIGSIPDPSMPLAVAEGGMGAVESGESGGTGGDGATRNAGGTTAVPAGTGGGGGGGGGLGVIRVMSGQIIEGDNVSPLPRN
jgi:hypothetical protein